MKSLVVKEKKGVFSVYNEPSGKNGRCLKRLKAKNHWDAIEEARELYDNLCIFSEIRFATGNLMKTEEFIELCEDGSFTDYNGYGYALNEMFEHIKVIKPSNKNIKCNYVLWFR